MNTNSATPGIQPLVPVSTPQRASLIPLHLGRTSPEPAWLVGLPTTSCQASRVIPITSRRTIRHQMQSRPSATALDTGGSSTRRNTHAQRAIHSIAAAEAARDSFVNGGEPARELARHDQVVTGREDEPISLGTDTLVDTGGDEEEAEEIFRAWESQQQPEPTLWKWIQIHLSMIPHHANHWSS